jgi:hypothetical protein
MTAVLAWFRLDIRRRWRSLLVLTLLIALASGAIMTAVAGAKRGASAMDRLQELTRPATILVQSATPGVDWTPVRELPEVEALSEVVFSGYEIDGELAPESFMLPPADAEAMRTVERPVVLQGRLADPDRADEVVVTPAFLDTFGKSVGDSVALGLYAPEQVDTSQGPDTAYTSIELWLLTGQQQAAAVEAKLDPNDVAPAAGPVVDATIVGVIRSPFYGDTLDSPGFVIPSPGLYTEYAPNLLGAQGLASVNALVRLDGGEAAIPGFLTGLTEVAERSDIDIDIQNLAALTRLHDSTGFEASSLFVVAAAATIAAAVLIGLAVARYTAVTVTDLNVLRAVGLTPGQLIGVAAAGPTAAAMAGTAIGAMAAVLASRWFPIGSASHVEPVPGTDVDVSVLALGLLGAVLTVAAVAVSVAGRSAGFASSPRRSAVATAATKAGFPVPVVMGTRLALESGRGRQAVPARPALVGAVAGVTGMLAALTFSSAVHDAATNPARNGIVHQAEAWVGFGNVTFAPADRVFPALAAVPGVSGLNEVRVQAAESGGESVNVFSFSSIGTPPNYIVTEGRLPVSSTETMLTSVATDALGVGVGDTVTITSKSGEAELVVVGVGVIDRELGPMAVTTPEAYDALFGDEFMMHYGEIALEPGIEPEAILPELSAAALVPEGSDFGLFPKEFTSLTELRFMRPLPLFLAGFLAVLALVAVGYALVMAVRRRRRDLAVLRAVGMTPMQSRGVVLNQATLTALVGLAVGIPLGVALGRTVWRYVADLLFLHYVPPVTWLALALVVPAALLAAVLLAAHPSHRAATTRVADVLRAE